MSKIVTYGLSLAIGIIIVSALTTPDPVPRWQEPREPRAQTAYATQTVSEAQRTTYDLQCRKELGIGRTLKPGDIERWTWCYSRKLGVPDSEIRRKFGN